MNSWKGPLCLHFAGLGNSARIAPTPYGGVMRSIGTVFLLVLWSDVPASAQPAGEAHKIDYETAPLERRLLAERCLGGIVVDGSLGEADWQSAPVATNFIQSEPREGRPPPMTPRFGPSTTTIISTSVSSPTTRSPTASSSMT